MSMRSDRVTLGPRGRCWQEGARAGDGAAQGPHAVSWRCAGIVRRLCGSLNAAEGRADGANLVDLGSLVPQLTAD